MKDTDRRILESPLYQGEDEQVAYTLTTTPWGSSPSAVAVALKDGDGEDVSDTCLSGSPSVADDVITTPVVQSLTAGRTYRLEIKFTVAGNVEEAYAIIYGQP